MLRGSAMAAYLILLCGEARWYSDECAPLLQKLLNCAAVRRGDVAAARQLYRDAMMLSWRTGECAAAVLPGLLCDSAAGAVVAHAMDGLFLCAFCQ
jgi:hypothetical protein